MPGIVDHTEPGDLLAIGDRSGDLHGTSVPPREQPGKDFADSLVLDTRKVGVASACVAFGIGDLVGVAVDRCAEFAGPSTMIDVAVAKDHPVQPPAGGGENRRGGVLDGGVKGDRSFWSIDQVNVRGEGRTDAHLPHTGRDLRDDRPRTSLSRAHERGSTRWPPRPPARAR
jgi:hypothetical protein